MGTTTTNPIHKSHVSLSNLHLALALAALAACAANAALPTGYTELEYFSIAGNGAANNSSTPLGYWLDTGVVTKHDWTFEVAFAYDQLANSSYQSCLLWDDGELVRNYIAVSNTATGSVGLYDTANEVFYGNANPSSATFIGGPALLEPQPAQRHTIITVR